MPLGNAVGNLHRRAFPQIVDIGLKGEAKAGDFNFAGPLVVSREAVCHRCFDLIKHPVRFAVVNFTSGTDQPRLLRVLRHDKPRVDRDTVAAYARPRL